MKKTDFFINQPFKFYMKLQTFIPFIISALMWLPMLNTIVKKRYIASLREGLSVHCIMVKKILRLRSKAQKEWHGDTDWGPEIICN